MYNCEPLKENNSSKITKLDDGYFGNLMNGGGFCTQNCTTFYFNCTDCYCHEYGRCMWWNSIPINIFIEILGKPNCYDTNPETSIDEGDSGGGSDGGSDPGDSDIATNPNPTEPCQDSSGQVVITDSSGCKPVTETTQLQKNCEQLNITGSNQKIKESFQDLQSKAADAFITREFGYKLTLGEDPEQLQLEDDLTQLKPEYGGQIYGMSHTHQDKLPNGDKVFPMFSAKDLFNLAIVVIRHSVYPKEFDLYVLTLTVKTDNCRTETFALKINNWLDFVSWMNEYWASPKQDRKRCEKNLIKKYEKIYNADSGNIPENYLKPFFKFLQDNDVKGVDIYQADDKSLNDWKRLELKNSSIIEENC